MAQLKRVKKAATVAGTFAVALSIGYVMQYGDADAGRVIGGSPSSSRPVIPAQLDSSPLKRAVDYVPKLAIPVVQRNTDATDDVLRVAPSTIKLTALVADAAASRTVPAAELEKAAETASCDVTLSTAVAEDAQIVLSVLSPCRVRAPFDVQHNGMVFTAMTDDAGQASVTVPSLSVNASLFVSFEDGGGATASVVVPEAAAVNRVVVQWDSVNAKMIQPADIESASLGKLNHLGTRARDDAHYAEVFTFPDDIAPEVGLAGLTVQAPVTEATCGADLQGQSFFTAKGVASTPNDFRITLPACEQIGTFLELKKILGAPTLLQE